MLKKFIYRIGINLIKLLWRAQGKRKITAFGETLFFSAETAFPSYRRLRLPRGKWNSEIVRYGDFVQFHAIINFMQTINKQPLIVDVGAYHGAYACVLGKIAQKMGGKVIAVEPNPHSFMILEKNIRLNELQDTVICEHTAVSDKAGTCVLLLQGSESHISNNQESGCKVKVMTLKDIFEKNEISHVDLLMIDAEGVELQVLRGFPWEIAKVDRIFCEFHPYAWNDIYHGNEDFERFLAEHNYRCFDMYFQEHKVITDKSYIGPTVFVANDIGHD